MYRYFPVTLGTRGLVFEYQFNQPVLDGRIRGSGFGYAVQLLNFDFGFLDSYRRRDLQTNELLVYGKG